MPFTFKSAQKAVSIFLLAGLFLFLSVFFLIGKGSDLFTFKDTYYTELEEGYGLEQGMKIKYKNAVIVGRIKKLQLTENNKIHVEVTIFSDYRRLIREDSVLKVQSSLLGGATFALLPSLDPNAQPLLPGSEILSSDMAKGQEIMLKLSEASPKKDDLMQKVNDILAYVGELKPVINATLLNVRDSTGSLKSIMGGLQGTDRSLLSDKLMSSLENLRSLTRNFSELSAQINSEDNTIGAIIRDKKSLYRKIDAMISNVDSSLKNVRGMTENLSGSSNDIKALLALLQENLIESKKVLTGLKNVLGGEKESDRTIRSGDRNR